jgi:hypothetical protein
MVQREDVVASELVERVARAIALGHGSKMVYQHPTDGMQTVASMAGFGRWGDSPERYSWEWVAVRAG